jgi:hypothetical protein
LSDVITAEVYQPSSYDRVCILADLPYVSHRLLNDWLYGFQSAHKTADKMYWIPSRLLPTSYIFGFCEFAQIPHYWREVQTVPTD